MGREDAGRRRLRKKQAPLELKGGGGEGGGVKVGDNGGVGVEAVAVRGTARAAVMRAG